MDRILIQLLVIFFIMLGKGSHVCGQSITLNEFQLKEDISVYVNALKECHPGMTLHLSEDDINGLFDELLSTSGDIELADFFRLLKRSVTKIQDAHTDIYPGKLYTNTGLDFPLKVKIIEDKIFTRISENLDLSDEYVEVLSINGEKSQGILTEIYFMTPSDGDCRDFKSEFTERAFSMQFANLIGRPESFEVELLLNENDTLRKVLVPSLMNDDSVEPLPCSFEMFSSDGYAVLTINSFDFKRITESGIDFHKFLRKAFKKLRIKNIEHLIVDVRENYGGHNILGIGLYSYLTDGSFSAMTPSITRLSGLNSISEYSNYPKGEYPFERWCEVEPLEGDSFLIVNDIDSQTSFDSNYIYRGRNQKKSKISRNKYDGNIYCLTSGMTFSAGSNFVSLLSRDENVIFIGRESGGANGKFCGGGFYNVTLPNSQFVLSIPFMQRCVFGFENEDASQRIVPDFSIGKSLSSRDEAMELTIELIRKSINE